MAATGLFVKLDVCYYEDEAILGIDGMAELLYVRALCLSKRLLSDGFIGSRQLARIAPIGTDSGHLVSELVRVGLLAPEVGGYQVRPTLSRSSHRRRHRRHIPNALRRQVFARDEHRCVVCGAEDMLSLDHVLPYVRGGGDTEDNLRTLCLPCNKSRGPGRW
jgi:5-methylcytosine-specific restriction endonuclease McrA